MTGLGRFWSPEEDIGRLKATGDYRTLIRLMGSPDSVISERAVAALAEMGDSVRDALHDALLSRNADIRLGAVEALGIIRDPASVPFLIALLEREQKTEIRWGAILALGEIGDPAAVGVCRPLLRDRSRYVRYGAAIVLRRLSWVPADEPEQAYFHIALQDWPAVARLGKAAAGPLLEIMNDDDPAVRVAAVGLLAQIGGPHAQTACEIAIRDKRDAVRFSGVLSAVRSGLAKDRLPLLLSRRERTGPDPFAAALLNFFFIGIGYNYIGKWWGFLVFMAYMSILVLAQFELGPVLPSLLTYPVTGILAIQTYREAQRMREG